MDIRAVARHLVGELRLRDHAAVLRWWVLMVPLLVVVFVIVCKKTGLDYLVSRELHDEEAALAMTGVAFGLALWRFFRHRTDTYMILGFLAFALLFREIHLSGTGNLVYFNVAAVFVCMAIWRDRIRADFLQPGLLSCFVGMWGCYGTALLIARRVFKGIPGEKLLHIPLEETLETAGHLFLICLFITAPALIRAIRVEKMSDGGDAGQISLRQIHLPDSRPIPEIRNLPPK